MTTQNEIDRQQRWVQQFSTWEYNCGNQCMLYVEPVDGKRWCAMVYVGLGSMAPVRQTDKLESEQQAKRWAVLALHEVARAMLDVPIPNIYAAVATEATPSDEERLENAVNAVTASKITPSPAGSWRKAGGVLSKSQGQQQ